MADVVVWILQCLPDGVNVEIGSTTLPELVLHSGLVRVVGTSLVEPVSVDGPIRTSKTEGETGTSIILVQHRDLVGDLRVTERYI